MKRFFKKLADWVRGDGLPVFCYMIIVGGSIMLVLKACEII